MKVLQITPFTGGGMIHYGSQQANALNNKVELEVIVPPEADISLFDSSVQISKLPMPTTRSDLSLSTGVNFWRLVKSIKKTNPNVVHITGKNELINLLIPLLRLLQVRTIYTLHDVIQHTGEFRLYSELSNYVASLSDVVIVHGEYNQTNYRRKFHRLNSEPIMHGDYSFFRNYCGEEIKYESELLFFGRLKEYKGLETLVKAAEILENKKPNFQITIAGKGDLDLGLEERINDTNIIQYKNKFISNEEACRLFSRCSGVVLPYTDASNSGVIPIAYSFSKPVIGTRVGALPEVISHGETGFIIEPNNQHQLAKYCEKLLMCDRNAKELGQNARTYCDRKMDWDHIANDLVEVYEEDPR